MRAHWIKPEAIVIDVGISFVLDEENQSGGEPERITTGDIEFNEECLQRVSKITPVPGGVGPMTVTMLMANLVESWELALQNRFVGQEIEERYRLTSMRSRGILEETRVRDLDKASHEFSYNLNLHKSLELLQSVKSNDSDPGKQSTKDSDIPSQSPAKPGKDIDLGRNQQ